MDKCQVNRQISKGHQDEVCGGEPERANLCLTLHWVVIVNRSRKSNNYKSSMSSYPTRLHKDMYCKSRFYSLYNCLFFFFVATDAVLPPFMWSLTYYFSPQKLSPLPGGKWKETTNIYHVRPWRRQAAVKNRFLSPALYAGDPFLAYSAYV